MSHYKIFMALRFFRIKSTTAWRIAERFAG